MTFNFKMQCCITHCNLGRQLRKVVSITLRRAVIMSDMEEDEDYGFEYETDDEEEEDVAIENQVRSTKKKRPKCNPRIRKTKTHA